MSALSTPGLDRIDFARGRLFDTADLDEARELCARVLNPHTLALLGARQRLQARMEHLRLGPLALNRLTWGAAVAVDPDRLGGYYLLSLPLRGTAQFHHGARHLQVGPSCAGLVSAAPRFRFEATPDFEQLVLRLEAPAIDAGWRALSGRPPPRSIDFEPALPLAGLTWQALVPPLRLLAGALQGEFDPQALPHLATRIEDLLVTTLLLHQPHSMTLPEPAAAPPALLRRAEDWLRDHLQEPLSLGALALACGCSRRTLQRLFQQAYGLGPMQWLRRERLAAVRRCLRAGDAGVTETALRHGFTHLGEFGRAYRAAFGETPAATRARAR